MVNRTCCKRNKLPVILEVRRGWLWIAVALRGNVVVITYCKYVPGPVTHTRGPWIPAAGPCLVPSLWHLLSRCPWLTLPCYIAGERKNNVGCLIACLLASPQPLRSQNSTPPTLSACRGPLNKQWLTCSLLPPTYRGKQGKKEKIMWFGSLWFSMPPPQHLRISEIPVGGSELALSGCIPAQSGGLSPFLALPGWPEGSRAENHLQNRWFTNLQ